MSDMEIRELNQEEKLDALNLAREVFFSEHQLGYGKEGSDAFLSFLQEDTGDLAMLGAFNRQLLGMLAYQPETFHIALFFVRSKQQKQGIGRQLLQHLIQKARQTHIARLSVNAAATAEKAYTALGFQRAGEPTEVRGITSIPMEYLLGTEYLGRTVTVTVDRPYGSIHPYHPDVLYPLNYGYVDSLVSGDGEFQDAYVYGPQEPLETFTGIVIAIIYRRDDCEAKWVVAADQNFSRRDVINAVGFQEQYFDTQFLWLDKAA